jgi:hypothetical protein
MSGKRIPEKDSEFFNYLIETRNYLKNRFRPQIIQAVGANTTENLLNNTIMPPHMMVTLANTGAPGIAPDLYFCLAAADNDACVMGAAITVVAGASSDVLISALGGVDLNNLNVTNASVTDGTTAQVIFQENWQRLGLLESQQNAWLTKTDLLIHKQMLIESELTRTPALINERNMLKAEFFDFAEPILKQIEGSLNLTLADREVFNIPVPDRTRTPRGPIGDSKPVVEVIIQGGGDLRFRARVGTDSNRASRHPLSDGIEIKYALLNIGDPPPASLDACTHSTFSSKSIFVIALGPLAEGKKFYGYARWINTSNPTNNGSWSTQFQAVVA